MAVRVKGSARKIGCADCFLFFRQPAINGCLSNLLFKPPATVKPVAIYSLPHGEGWGEGILRISATFPNTLVSQTQALRLVVLSLTLSHGREDGAAVGIKGSARKIGCVGCFLLFRRPAINGCKPKLLFKSPTPVKPAAICSLPRGGGLGRGHSPNFGNLSQHSNHSKYKPCGLLPSL